jgi:hypothetical protein
MTYTRCISMIPNGPIAGFSCYTELPIEPLLRAIY